MSCENFEIIVSYTAIILVNWLTEQLNNTCLISTCYFNSKPVEIDNWPWKIQCENLPKLKPYPQGEENLFIKYINNDNPHLLWQGREGQMRFKFQTFMLYWEGF